MACNDPGFLGRQYADAANLGARVALHERFSASRRPWHRWVFDNLDLPEDARVLEVGCGPGYLWAANLDRLPPGWSVTLTDSSAGMLRAARSRLVGSETFGFRVADVRDLPFEDGAFDAVLANHMLYHLPDTDPALEELSRVLRKTGTLYAATNGRNAHREMGWMQRALDPSRPDDRHLQASLSFSLENGDEQLLCRFEQVSLRRHEDALVVTEAGPLLDYLLSGSAADAARQRTGPEELRRRAARLRENLQERLAAEGEVRITKDSGLFVARGPR